MLLTAAVPVEQLVLGLLKDVNRQAGGSSTEIEDTAVRLTGASVNRYNGLCKCRIKLNRSTSFREQDRKYS